MNILITGGAGYIGSHVTKQLLKTTIHNITVLDNLSTGHQETLNILEKIRDFNFIKLDLKDFDAVEKLLETNTFDTILHFAASIVVSESVSNPIKYYMNNTVNTTNLIQCAIQNNIKKFVFSSTAAVYGNPSDNASRGITEEDFTKPINPYGMSKLMSEQILQDTANTISDFKYLIFRYFNVAGADIHYEENTLIPRFGQRTENATHLIKIASECATSARDEMSIFGTNYPTKDGTCIRDYIHVDDLAFAHVQGIEYLENNPSNIFNVGYGKGYSVKEVIKTMKKISNKDFMVKHSELREGDPAILISDNSKIKQTALWKPQYDELELICKSAYLWEQKINS
jgi:UDP-glucose 4-epimerase